MLKYMLAICGLCLATVAFAQDTETSEGDGKGSGAPIPRFASLRDHEANLRTGPGVRYPIAWKYTRKSMPVEIIAEFDTWRKVRDWQNTEGWVHRVMLSSRRTGVVTPKIESLHSDNRESSKTIAKMESGVIVNIDNCNGNWCKVKVESFKGYVKRASLWGVYEDEKIE